MFGYRYQVVLYLDRRRELKIGAIGSCIHRPKHYDMKYFTRYTYSLHYEYRDHEFIKDLI